MSNNKISYRNATGVIEFTLKNDLMFHYVMQKSRNALIGLVCSLKGLSPDDVEDVIVLNPIDINSIQKETVMDLKHITNNNEILRLYRRGRELIKIKAHHTYLYHRSGAYPGQSAVLLGISSP